MDLTAEKAKRDARIKAKEDRIKSEVGSPESVQVPEVKELAEAPKK